MRARERALYVMLFALLLALVVAPTATMLDSSGLGLFMWVKGLLGPDGHFKFPHLWPPKLPQAGQPNYESSAVLSAMREAASLRR